jgi:hypothetical protein
MARDHARVGRRAARVARAGVFGLVFCACLPASIDAQAVPAFSGRYRFVLTMSPRCPAATQVGPLSILVNVTEAPISAGAEVAGQSASSAEVPNQGRFVLQRVGSRVHGAFGASTQEFGLATEGQYRVWLQIMSDGSASQSSGGRARATGTAFGEVELSLSSDPTGNPTGYCEFATGHQWTLEPA